VISGYLLLLAHSQLDQPHCFAQKDNLMQIIVFAWKYTLLVKIQAVLITLRYKNVP